MEEEQQITVISAKATHATKLVRQFEDIMRDNHLSYRQLAELTGELHAPHINRMTSGKVKPTIDFLEKCLEPMGYTLAIVPKK